MKEKQDKPSLPLPTFPSFPFLPSLATIYPSNIPHIETSYIYTLPRVRQSVSSTHESSQARLNITHFKLWRDT